jgi:hypothetical protein
MADPAPHIVTFFKRAAPEDLDRRVTRIPMFRGQGWTAYVFEKQLVFVEQEQQGMSRPSS